MSAAVQASEGAELPPLTEAEVAEIEGLVARAPGHVEGARATLREQHEAHAREQEREAAEHWEIGTRLAGTELRLAIARAEALALAGRLLTDLRRAHARIADLEAQIAATAAAHREDQRRADELAGVPG